MIADFYFGVGSRYSYLASTQLAALEAETGVKFNWLAVDSAQLIATAHGGRSPFAGTNGSGQYDWGYRQKDAEAWAALYGVPFREPHGRLALDPNLLSLACAGARRRRGLRSCTASRGFRRRSACRGPRCMYRMR